MDSLTPSTDLSSGKATNFASGILSSLSSFFGANAAGEGVFANFLVEEQANKPSPPPSPNTNQSSASTQNTTPQDNNSVSGIKISANDPTAIKALKSLIFGLHRIINKLKKQENDQAASGHAKTNNANASNNTPNSISQPQTAAASDASSNISSSSGDNSDTAPPTLADLLSNLTALMKVMEKKLEVAQEANGDSGTQTADAGNGTSDGTGTGAADPLTQLLSLVQLIQQQLTAATGGTSPDATTAATSGDTVASGNASLLATALQDLMKIQKDLKGLMAALQGSSTDGDAGLANASASANTNNAQGAATDNLLQTTDTTMAPNKPSLASQDSSFGLFGAGFHNPFSNNAATNLSAPVNTNSPIAAAASNLLSDGSGTAQDNGFSQDGGSSLTSDNNSANLNGLNANAAASAGASDGSNLSIPMRSRASFRRLVPRMAA